jgi:phage terminase large subunit-like protein
VLEDYFGGCRETAVILPKKNGKTALAAALSLFELVTTPDAEVALAAASRDQAWLVFRAASGMVRRSPYLTARLRPTMREMRSRCDSGILRVLAAEVNTADGWNGSACVVDELHRHKSPELYGVLRDGLGPRGGRMLVISTAGDDEESPLGRIRQAAHKLPVVARERTYLHARSPDGAFAFHEYALTPGEDVNELELVKKANPSSWHTVKSLRAERESPTMVEWHWRRFRCGLWERGEDAAVRPEDWDAVGDPTLTIPDGAEVLIGLDLGWRLDTTAIVPLHTTPDGHHLVAGAIVLEPPKDGGMLDELLIEEALVGLHRRFQVQGVVYDPHAGGQQLAQRLQREHDMVFMAHSQDSSPMALAASRLMEAIRTQRLAHDADRVLRSHVLNARQQTVSGEKWKFARPPRGRRVPIDALTALAMVLSVAAGSEGPKIDVSEYRITRL